jgi:poly-beta-hydroxybutyrate-responsive repressor
MSDTRTTLIPDLDRPLRDSAALDQCPCAGGTLDRLVQPAILVALADESMHGYRLHQRLGEGPVFGGRAPDSTGLYRALKTLEKRGLVTSSWDLGERGPARRLYTLTPAGSECLERWTATLAHYHAAIGALIDLAAGARLRSESRCDRELGMTA